MAIRFNRLLFSGALATIHNLKSMGDTKNFLLLVSTKINLCVSYFIFYYRGRDMDGERR